MAIVFEKTKVKGGFPIFWRGEFAVLPGDFKLKGTYPEGTKIPKGTPIKLDFDNMECSICKSARVCRAAQPLLHMSRRVPCSK